MRRLLMILAVAFAVPAQADATGDRLIACAPATFDAAVNCLDKHLPEESKDALRERGGASRSHFGLGMWLRNNWGLWSGGKLQQAMKTMGFQHPDDMSGTIIEAEAARLRGETFDVAAKIAGFAQYWKRRAPANMETPR